jgi:outer membrane protein TolC
LKATYSDLEAADEQKKAAFSGFMPRLSLQGGYTYLSTLPSLNLNPATGPIRFGDHSNYNRLLAKPWNRHGEEA